MLNDYMGICLEECYIFEQEYTHSLLEQYEIEAEFILQCLESAVVLEAEVEKKGFFASIIESVKAFFSKIFGVFRNKSEELAKKDNAWLDANYNIISNLNYEGLEVQVANLWNSTQAGTIKPALDAIYERTKNVSDADILKYSVDENTLTNFILSRAKIKVEKDGNTADTIKAYFRTGSKPLQTVTLSGNKLKELCTGEFRNYVSNYRKSTLPFIEQSMKNAVSALEAFENLKTVNESFDIMEQYCALEQTTYGQTDISSLFGDNVVMEGKWSPFKGKKKTPTEPEKNPADDDKPVEQTQSNNNDPVNPKTVKVNDTNDPKNDTEGDKIKNGINKTQGSITEARKKYLKEVASILKLAVSAGMSVLEEKYIVRMNVLKQVVDARGDGAERTAPDQKGWTPSDSE